MASEKLEYSAYVSFTKVDTLKGYSSFLGNRLIL